MVKLHAELAELPALRTTVDVDSTLHLETGAITFPQAAALLQGVGYVLDTSTKHAYRFDRGQTVSREQRILCGASLPSGQKSTGIAANSDKDTMIATVKAWAEPRGYEVIVAG